MLATIMLLLPGRSTWAQGTAIPTVTPTSTAPATSTPTPLPDRDGDGVPDAVDNCPDNWNPGQSDADGNHVGDMCDASFTVVPLILRQVNLRGAGVFGDGHGTILIRGLIDATDWGSAAALLTSLSRGFAVHLDGAGLVTPGETITFAPCIGICRGNGPAVATFRQNVVSSPNLLTVKLTARGRTFAPPLAAASVAVTVSIGGRDRGGQIGGCKIGRSSRTANCRAPR